MGIILDHKVPGEIKRGKINPSSAICAANAEIIAMYGNKKKTLAYLRRHIA